MPDPRATRPRNLDSIPAPDYFETLRGAIRTFARIAALSLAWGLLLVCLPSAALGDDQPDEKAGPPSSAVRSDPDAFGREKSPLPALPARQLLDPSRLALGTHHYRVRSGNETEGTMEVSLRHNEQGLHVHGLLQLLPGTVHQTHVRLDPRTLEPLVCSISGRDDGTRATVLYDFEAGRVRGRLVQSRPEDGHYADLPVDLAAPEGVLPDLAWHWLMAARLPSPPGSSHLTWFEAKQARTRVLPLFDLGRGNLDLPSGARATRELRAGEGRGVRWHLAESGSCPAPEGEDRSCWIVVRLELESSDWVFDWIASDP